MYILNGLEMEKKSTIERSLKGILKFLEQELTEVKKEEYLNRKFKDSKEFVSIGFDSIEPIQLSIKHIYNKEQTQLDTLMHKDIFHPLFYGFMITNNQYKQLEGNGTERLNNRNNTNSFSDYFISRKVLDSVLPNAISLSIHSELDKESIKFQIIGELYRIFNEVASKLTTENKKGPGYDFFIDFNTIIDLAIPVEEKEQFVQQILLESGMEIQTNYSSLESDRQLNGMLYLLDSICFQARKFFNVDVRGKRLEDVFSEEVNITFEVPTNEKPLLKKSRDSSVDNEGDIPKLNILEMILLRFLAVTINKQGGTYASGYWFYLKEGNDKNVSLERKMQIVSDSKGNLSINGIEYIDVRKEEALKNRIRTYYSHYFNEEVPEADALHMFKIKMLGTRDVYTVKQPKEKELIDLYDAKKSFKRVGKILYDGAFRNLSNRIMAYEEKYKKPLFLFHMLDLLFMLDVLLDGNLAQKGRLHFMSKKLNVKELLEKEILTPEEIHYLLGSLVALVIQDSRNRDSLMPTFLKLNRTKDILGRVNKRMESGVNEIKQLYWAADRMNVVTAHIEHLEHKKQMSDEEKFAYIAGLISGLRVSNKEKTNESTEGEK